MRLIKVTFALERCSRTISMVWLMVDKCAGSPTLPKSLLLSFHNTSSVVSETRSPRSIMNAQRFAIAKTQRVRRSSFQRDSGLAQGWFSGAVDRTVFLQKGRI